jgi:hypothetical protein
VLLPPQTFQNSFGPRTSSGRRWLMSLTVTVPTTAWTAVRTMTTARGRPLSFFRAMLPPG